MNLYQILEVVSPPSVHRPPRLPFPLPRSRCGCGFENEPNQNIKLYVWVTQFWDDVFLGWDPKEYDGIKSIVLPWKEVRGRGGGEGGEEGRG